MNNDIAEKNSNEFHASMLEALRQNWENARYFESRRWNYIYYYYFALGAAIIYFGDTFKECGFNFLQGDPHKFLFIWVVFLFLTLIGLGAFFQLAHANLEYKNFIRTNEFIAEDLKLNQGFRKFRIFKKEKRKLYKVLPQTKLTRCFLNKESRRLKDGKRKAYMALPLGIGIRRTLVSAIKLTALGVAFSGGVTIFYFIWFIILIKHIDLPYIYILLFAAVISIVICFWLICFYKKKENEAEYKLALRDPNRYKSNHGLDKDVQKKR